MRLPMGTTMKALASLLFLTLVMSRASAQLIRETDWIESPSRPGVYLARFDSLWENLDWWRGKAGEFGGRIGSFETEAENLQLGPQLLEKVDRAWVGLTRASDNDPWIWETGVLLNYPLDLTSVDPGDFVVWGVVPGSVPTYVAWGGGGQNLALLEVDFEDCDGDGEHDPLQALLNPTLDWDSDGTLDICEEQGAVYCASSNPNSVNQIGKVRALGTNQVGDNDLILYTYDLPPGVFGYWLISMTKGFIPDLGGGLGTLCLGGQIIRFNVPPYGVFQVPADGRVATVLDMTQIPKVGSIHSGETWNFQVWHRDLVNNELTHNTTEAIEISFQ